MKGNNFFVDATTGNRRFNGKTTLGVVGFIDGKEVMRSFRQLSIEMNIFESETAAITNLLGRLVAERDQLFGSRSRKLGKASVRSERADMKALVIDVPLTVHGDNASVVDFILKMQKMSDSEFNDYCKRFSAKKEYLTGLRRLLGVFPKMKMKFVPGAQNYADAPSRKIGVNV